MMVQEVSARGRRASLLGVTATGEVRARVGRRTVRVVAESFIFWRGGIMITNSEGFG
jgi:hypothetical protein